MVNFWVKWVFWNDELVDLMVVEFEVFSCLVDWVGEDIGYCEFYD